MRVAAIQMNSGADVDANLKLADRLLADAAADDVST
jgi:predicted amidohydrolase